MGGFVRIEMPFLQGVKSFKYIPTSYIKLTPADQHTHRQQMSTFRKQQHKTEHSTSII